VWLNRNYYAVYLLWWAEILELDFRWENSYWKLMEAAKIFEENNDTDELIRCYINVSIVLVNLGNSEQALKYVNQALELSSPTDIDIRSNCYNNIAQVYLIQGNLEESLKYEVQALDLLKHNNDNYSIAICLDNIGSTLFAKGETEDALAYHKQAQSIFVQIGDLSHIAQNLNSIGEVFRWQGDSKQALSYYKQAFDIYDQINDLQGKAYVLNDMGCAYDILGDSEQAINCFRNTLEFLEENPTAYNNKSQTLNNLGLSYLFQDKRIEAQKYFEKGLEIAEKFGYKVLIGLSLNNLGIVCQHQGMPIQAEQHYKRALALREEIGNLSEIAQTTHNLGDLYFAQALLNMPKKIEELPFSENMKIYVNPLTLQKAIDQFEKALHYYEQSGKGFEPDIADELENLALCNTILRDQSKAMNYIRRAQKIRESSKDIPHQVFTGKSSSIDFSVSEDTIRKITTQIVDLRSEDILERQKFSGRKKNKSHKRHR